MKWAGPTPTCGGYKIRRISQARSPSPKAGPPAQGPSGRNVSPHNFQLQKPAGIESVEETSGAPSSSSEPIHGITQTHSL